MNLKVKYVVDYHQPRIAQRIRSYLMTGLLHDKSKDNFSVQSTVININPDKICHC